MCEFLFQFLVTKNIFRIVCVSLQVARRTYKGIPEKLRGLVWSLLLGIEQEAKRNVGVYEVSAIYI